MHESGISSEARRVGSFVITEGVVVLALHGLLFLFCAQGDRLSNAGESKLNSEGRLDCEVPEPSETRVMLNRSKLTVVKSKGLRE